MYNIKRLLLEIELSNSKFEIRTTQFETVIDVCLTIYGFYFAITSSSFWMSELIFVSILMVMARSIFILNRNLKEHALIRKKYSDCLKREKYYFME